jgi:hypothetical protein
MCFVWNCIAGFSGGDVPFDDLRAGLNGRILQIRVAVVEHQELIEGSGVNAEIGPSNGMNKLTTVPR